MGGGIGVENPGAAGMDSLEAQLGLDCIGKPLPGSGQDNEPLALGKRKELINRAQVALGKVRECRAENEAEPAPCVSSFRVRRSGSSWG
jgi:hypothetical protein